jgi:hypothetical protein
VLDHQMFVAGRHPPQHDAIDAISRRQSHSEIVGFVFRQPVGL